MLLQPPTPAARARTRAWTLAVILWAFGLATTTLLVGLWGRTVTTDQPTLEASARTVVDAEVVSDRVQGWLGDAIAATSSVGGPEVAEALRSVAATPEVDRAVDLIVEDIVDAAMAPPNTTATIDVATALEPLTPVIIAELRAQGIDLPPSEVADAIDAASSVVLSTEASTTISGVASRTRSFLTTVLVTALAALILFGSLAISVADDHIAMVRSLAIRLAVSAVTFVIFLRIGAWAINPNQGRSPLAGGGSVLLASNHLVLFLFAAAALAVALAAGIMVRRRRLQAAASSDATGDDHTTEERVLVTV